MNVEKISEPIRVLAVCAAGAIDPVRFRWGQRTYKIDSVNARWTDRHRDGCSLHYSVQVGSETYYIHFSTRRVQWWLDEVVV